MIFPAFVHFCTHTALIGARRQTDREKNILEFFFFAIVSAFCSEQKKWSNTEYATPFNRRFLIPNTEWTPAKGKRMQFLTTKKKPRKNRSN